MNAFVKGLQRNFAKNWHYTASFFIGLVLIYGLPQDRLVKLTLAMAGGNSNVFPNSL